MGKIQQPSRLKKSLKNHVAEAVAGPRDKKVVIVVVVVAATAGAHTSTGTIQSYQGNNQRNIRTDPKHNPTAT